MTYTVNPDGTVSIKRPTKEEAQSWADYTKDFGSSK